MLQFTKMHGAGNDYVYIDCFSQPVPDDPAVLAPILSDRHKGIGGDGIVLICPSDRADARMRMFNADGSEAEMCGNAIRCVAKYVHDHGICSQTEMSIETGAGVLQLQLTIEDGKTRIVRVDMGEPILRPDAVPTTLLGSSEMPDGAAIERPLTIYETDTDQPIRFSASAVSMGNPHCVIFVDEITDRHVFHLGPQIEHADEFPNRVNVEFVELISPTELRMRVWERGSGETLACGTGACAVAIAGVLSGRSERRVTIHLLGGDLEIEWNETDNHVYKTGPAEELYSGVWEPN